MRYFDELDKRHMTNLRSPIFLSLIPLEMLLKTLYLPWVKEEKSETSEGERPIWTHAPSADKGHKREARQQQGVLKNTPAWGITASKILSPPVHPWRLKKIPLLILDLAEVSL